jgi:ribonuclease P protein component
VLDQGTPLHGGRVILFVAPGSGQTAFVAARRIGGAVQRNRARRILRAAWRQVAPQTDDRDVVLVAREGIRGAMTQDLVAEMTELLQRGGSLRP